MDDLVDYACIVSFGPRRSGKSTLMRMMLSSGLVDDYDNLFIFAPSSDMNGDYDDFKDEKNVTIYSDPTAELVNHIFNSQAKLKKAQRANTTGVICPSTVMIFDDIIDAHLVCNFGPVDRVAERGRHVDMAVFVLVQKLSAASRSVRINADYLFMFAPFSISETEQFLEQFVSRTNKRDLHELLQELFSYPYLFILVDNTEPNPALKLKYTDADHYMDNDVKQIDLRMFNNNYD